MSGFREWILIPPHDAKSSEHLGGCTPGRFLNCHSRVAVKEVSHTGISKKFQTKTNTPCMDE